MSTNNLQRFPQNTISAIPRDNPLFTGTYLFLCMKFRGIIYSQLRYIHSDSEEEMNSKIENSGPENLRAWGVLSAGRGWR